MRRGKDEYALVGTVWRGLFVRENLPGKGIDIVLGVGMVGKLEQEVDAPDT